MSQGSPQINRSGPSSLHIFAATMLVVFVLYRPTLRSEFVRLDDFQYVVNNKLVREPTLSGVATVFGETARPSTVEGYYQPLTMLSLMLDSLLAGPKAGPSIFHFTNIVLHGLNSFLVVLLLRRLLGLHRGLGATSADGWGDWGPALLAGMFFALHPVQVESIAWISQRKTLLATLFAIMSLLSYLEFGRTAKLRHLVICVLLYFLGTLAKPTIVLFPLVLPLLDRWPLRRPIVRSLPEKIPFALIMLLMGRIAWSSQAAFNQALMVPHLGSMTMAGRWAALISYNFILYMGNLLWPMYLSPFRAIPEALDLGDSRIFLALLGTVGVAGVWIASARYSRPLFTGLTAFLILLLPSLGGIRFMGSCVADRFLYLPLIFLLMPLVVLIARGDEFMRARAKEYRAVIALFALPLMILAWGQQNVWADSKTLYSHVTQTAPRWYKGHFNMALIYLEEEDFDSSIASADRAIALNPQDGPSFAIRGRALIRKKRLDEGLSALEHSLTLGMGPDEPEVLLSIAEGRALGSDLPGARAYVARAVALGVKPGEACTRVGDVLLRVGKQYDRAAEMLREAVAKDPQSHLAHLYLANALAALGRDDEALKEYDTSIELQRKLGFDVTELVLHTQRMRARDVSSSATSRPQFNGS
jgi:tetratricopeptide (TPR) repeat protein